MSSVQRDVTPAPSALADVPAPDEGPRRPPRGTAVLSRVPSPALVVGSIASVQFGTAYGATLFGEVGPGGAVLLRQVSATIALLLIWRPRPGSITRHQLVLAGLFGVVLATMNLAMYYALTRIPLGVCATIEFVGPLTVAIAGSRRRLDLVWVGLAAAGIIALMQGAEHGIDPLGVALALIAGGGWGVYILFQARLGTAFSDGSGLALALCVATVIALPFGIVDGGTSLLAAHALLVGGACGILSVAIPCIFEFEALKRIATGVFGVLMSIEPAMAALAGFVVLGQSLGTRQLAGIALVVAASIGASRRMHETDVLG